MRSQSKGLQDAWLCGTQMRMPPCIPLSRVVCPEPPSSQEILRSNFKNELGHGGVQWPSAWTMALGAPVATIAMHAWECGGGWGQAQGAHHRVRALAFAAP